MRNRFSVHKNELNDHTYIQFWAMPSTRYKYVEDVRPQNNKNGAVRYKAQYMPSSDEVWLSVYTYPNVYGDNVQLLKRIPVPTEFNGSNEAVYHLAKEYV